MQPQPKPVNNILEKRLSITKVRCPRQHFEDTLLIVALPTKSSYESIPLYDLLYRGGFKNRILCGPFSLSKKRKWPIEVVNTRNGAFLYDCLSHAVVKYPNFTGYLFIAEEILLNYWNLVSYDKGKIWQDSVIATGPTLYSGTPDNWEWWASPWGMRAVEKAFEYLVERNYGDMRKSKLSEGEWRPEFDVTNVLNAWLWNGNGEYRAYWINRTVLYIPKRHVNVYSKLAKIFRQSGVRHALALGTIIRLIELEEESLKLHGIALDNWKGSRGRESLSDASTINDFLYVSGKSAERRRSLNDLKLKEYAMGKFLYYDECPD